jgi:hypothetical protein
MSEMMDDDQYNIHTMNPSAGTEEISDTLAFNSALTQLTTSVVFNKFIRRESFKYYTIFYRYHTSWTTSVV